MEAETPEDLAIVARAHEWYIVLHDATPAQRAEFVRWLKASPRNVGEFLSVSAVYREFDGPGYGADIDVDALISSSASNVVSLDDEQTCASQPVAALAVLGANAPRFSPLVRWMGATALSLAVASAVAVTWMWIRSATPMFATARGEQRSLTLGDGTQVQLNTASRVRVQFDRTTREIELIDGEALFTVARDTARPFSVHSGRTIIQALGTQFNVQRKSDRVAVSVLEGRVAVADARTHRREILDAGTGVDVLPQGVLAPLKPIDIRRVVAWREKRLVFRADRLDEIVAEFNRYNAEPHFEIGDPAIGAKRFTGIFDAGAPESFARFLADIPEVQVQQDADHIWIRRAPAK
jgi:transmembrane sensor